MSDIISNDLAHTPHWRVLYHAAMLELDPAKLSQLISEARSPILDRIEDRFSTPLDGEASALRDALEMLSTLRTIAQREIGERKGSGIQNNAGKEEKKYRTIASLLKLRANRVTRKKAAKPTKCGQRACGSQGFRQTEKESPQVMAVGRACGSHFCAVRVRLLRFAGTVGSMTY